MNDLSYVREKDVAVLVTDKLTANAILELIAYFAVNDMVELGLKYEEADALAGLYLDLVEVINDCTR